MDQAAAPSGTISTWSTITGANCKVVQNVDSNGSTYDTISNVTTNNSCTLTVGEYNSGVFEKGFRSVISVETTQAEQDAFKAGASTIYLRASFEAGNTWASSDNTPVDWSNDPDTETETDPAPKTDAATALVSLGVASAIATTLLAF